MERPYHPVNGIVNEMLIPAMHEHEDHAPGPRSEMRRLESQQPGEVNSARRISVRFSAASAGMEQRTKSFGNSAIAEGAAVSLPVSRAPRA